ncbi:MAG: SoxR reducing system RseC family protein [Treponema sp.]|jgi:positive regulator of sigma E activity|nr:SoxR reducing system RseC family protein [Treponema sp.]
MRGRVLDLSGNLVTLEPERPPQCFGCVRGECKKMAPVKAENTLDRELALGRLVEIGVSGTALFIQALEAFLPPLAGFAGGYLLTAWRFPSLGEAPRAAAGVLLLFAAAAAFYAFRKRFPPKTILRIRRVL